MGETVAQGDLSVAICSYLGHQRASFPQSDWQAVVEALGAERAIAIEIPLLLVLAETREITPDWHDQTLYQASEWAVRQVRARHAGIDDRASKALVWMYSFENR